MGLREFFAELADLMERYGVDVSAEDYGAHVALHFTCEDQTHIDAPWTINARQARFMAAECRPRPSFPVGKSNKDGGGTDGHR